MYFKTTTSMKKNLFFGIAAIAGMLFAASCSQDKDVLYTPDGEETQVTFVLNAPAELGVRTGNNGMMRLPGDGTRVTQVAFAVFDAGGNEITALRDNDVTMSAKTATKQVTLIKGQTYKIVCFAYADANLFDFRDLKNITINYGACNNEALDAFVGQKDITAADWANPLTNVDITLYRPFAQLNIASSAEDWAAAARDGLTTGLQSQVTVTNVYSAFDAYANEVPATATTADVTFAYAPAVADVLTVNGTDYNYVALAYFLAGDANSQQALTDVTFSWKSNNGAETTHTYANIPVQRNYRTNIIGNIFSNPVNVNIVVDEQFNTPDKEVNIVEVAANNQGEFTDAITNAQVGQTTVIKLADNTSYNFTGTVTNKDIVLEGKGENTVVSVVAGYPSNAQSISMKNLTLECGNGNYRGFQHTNTLNMESVTLKGKIFTYGDATFKNCTFIQDAPDDYNIWVYAIGYTCLFDHCSFTGDGKAILIYNEATVWNAAYNVTVNNCTFNSTSTAVKKAAIEIHTEQTLLSGGSATNNVLTINNTTTTGYWNGTWIELNNTANPKEQTTFFKVVVDGTPVQAGV